MGPMSRTPDRGKCILIWKIFYIVGKMIYLKSHNVFYYKTSYMYIYAKNLLSQVEDQDQDQDQDPKTKTKTKKKVYITPLVELASKEPL